MHEAEVIEVYPHEATKCELPSTRYITVAHCCGAQNHVSAAVMEHIVGSRASSDAVWRPEFPEPGILAPTRRPGTRHPIFLPTSYQRIDKSALEEMRRSLSVQEYGGHGICESVDNGQTRPKRL